MFRLNLIKEILNIYEQTDINNFYYLTKSNIIKLNIALISTIISAIIVFYNYGFDLYSIKISDLAIYLGLNFLIYSGFGLIFAILDTYRFYKYSILSNAYNSIFLLFKEDFKDDTDEYTGNFL